MLRTQVYNSHQHHMPYFERDTKKFGFDLKGWIAANKAEGKSDDKKPAPAKAAKKAKKR